MLLLLWEFLSIARLFLHTGTVLISASKAPTFHLKDFLTKKKEGSDSTSRSLHPDNVQKILIFPLHFPSCPSLKSAYCLFLVKLIPNPILRKIPFLFCLRHSNTPAPQMIGIAYSNRKKNSFMDDIFILFY